MIKHYSFFFSLVDRIGAMKGGYNMHHVIGQKCTRQIPQTKKKLTADICGCLWVMNAPQASNASLHFNRLDSVICGI